MLILSTALCTNGASTPNPLGQPISTYHRRLCCCCYLYFLLCYDKKEKRQVMHWKTQNTACSYAHGDTFFFHLATSPLSNTKNICQSIILSLSLFSAIIIIIEKKRKSVGRVFRKYQCCWYLKIKRWRDINISLSMYLRPYSMLVAQHKVIGHAQTVLVFRRTITCRLSCQ